MQECVNFHSQRYWPTLLDGYYSLLSIYVLVTFFLNDTIKYNYQVIFRA